MGKENEDIVGILRRLAMRNHRLRRLQNLGAPEEILQNEQRIIKQAELELQISEKRTELSFYEERQRDLDIKRENSFCPGCKYIYETLDGRRLTDEEVTSADSHCTLHSGREDIGYCEDFVDYGVVKWNEHFKAEYNDLKLAARLVQEAKQKISELEQELQSL